MRKSWAKKKWTTKIARLHDCKKCVLIVLIAYCIQKRRRLLQQVQQIGEEQSELNTKLSADLTHQMDELRLSNADLTDQMRSVRAIDGWQRRLYFSRLQNNYETVMSGQAEEEEEEQ
jgi:uncharacterized coiled-coil DUF342 family protein